MNKHVEGQSAYLLHSRKYTDSRILLELLTEKDGRISGVLRHRSNNKKRPQPQQFSPLYLEYGGRSALKNILLLEPHGVSTYLQGESLYCALYVNEILLRVLAQDDPCPTIYGLYEGTLVGLAQASNSKVGREVCLRNFELSLLDTLGFAIDFSADAFQNPITPGSCYAYQAGQGFVPLNPASDDAFSPEHLAALSARAFDNPVTLRLAKRLCRLALQPLIGHRPLKSRDLFT